MKLFKNYVVIIALISFVVLNINPIKIYAFGGYTHHYIGSLTCKENMFGQYENEDLKSYKSGTIVADIGLLSWDKEYTIQSDSIKFKNKMVEIASKSNSKNSKLFALGWSDHVYQDKNGSIKRIISNNEGYRKNCLIVDKYIMGQTGQISFEDLYVDYDLIRDTYKDLCNFSPTDEQIKTELKTFLEMLNLMVNLTVKELTPAEKEKALAESAMISKNCGIKNPDSILLQLY